MNKFNIFLLAATMAGLGWTLFSWKAPGVVQSNEPSDVKKTPDRPDAQKAVFAGGCFWCVEADFKKVPGVIEVISGYTGGLEKNPTYAEVSSGRTGHVEAVQIFFDPKKITYEALLDIFWQHIDPTDGGGQFVDRGSQYRSAIFYTDAEQKRIAEASKEKLAQSGKFRDPIVTRIRPLDVFYPAEDDHQNFFLENPDHYQRYRKGSGRDRFIEKMWGRPGESHAGATSPPEDKQLKERLTPLQYRVTQEEATEPPFDNPYWNHKAEGIYVDIVSGEPLFSSRDKFDSNCGWPSFSKPLESDNIVEKEDRKLFMVRTEVRSRHGNSHLGHVFPDGPQPTGLRYCINSAALRFIPLENLEEENYGEYRKLFTDPPKERK